MCQIRATHAMLRRLSRSSARQRCLAHPICKASALAEGYYGAGSGFGRDLARDLRRLTERVHQSSCQSKRHEVDTKVRKLTGEILHDWYAVIAFVADPGLPPTNNDAERALRHAEIPRRINVALEPMKAVGSMPSRSALLIPAASAALNPWAFVRPHHRCPRQLSATYHPRPCSSLNQSV